jgi:hypothetical protein
MIEPVTAAVAVGAATQIVSGISNYINAEKDRKEQKKRYKEMKGWWDELVPPEYNLTPNSPPDLIYQKLNSPEFAERIASGNYDLSKIQRVRKFAPQIAPYIEEKAPELIKDTQGMLEGRAAQRAALQRYMEASTGSEDPEYRELMERASKRATADAASRQASLMQQYARRGIGGSGLELQSQLGSQAAENERQGMESLSAATQAQKNRLTALAAGASLGERISNQDLTQQQINMNAINAFNQRAASNRQNYEGYRTGLLNDADMFNLTEDQRLSEYNRTREDRLKQLMRSEQASERDRMDSIARDRYANDRAERSYEDQLKLGRYNLAAAEKDRMNSLLRQQYEDRLQKLRGKMGLSASEMQNNTQAARDRIAATQGISDAIGSGADAYANSEDRKRKRHYDDQWAASQGYAPYEG